MITLLGLLLLLFAVQQWRTRPNPGTSVAPPAWFDLVDALGPRACTWHRRGAVQPHAEDDPADSSWRPLSSGGRPRHRAKRWPPMSSTPPWEACWSRTCGAPFPAGSTRQVIFLRWKDWLLRNNNAVMAIGQSADGACPVGVGSGRTARLTTACPSTRSAPRRGAAFREEPLAAVPVTPPAHGGLADLSPPGEPLILSPATCAPASEGGRRLCPPFRSAASIALAGPTGRSSSRPSSPTPGLRTPCHPRRVC